MLHRLEADHSAIYLQKNTRVIIGINLNCYFDAFIERLVVFYPV